MRIRRGTACSRSWCASATLLLVALVAGVSGCGGDAEAKAACEAQAKKAAEAAVVAAYYERGRLGTRAQVQRQLGHRGVRFFDTQGHMLGYAQMTPEAQAVFNRWVANTRVGDVTAEARRKARDEADPDC